MVPTGVGLLHAIDLVSLLDTQDWETGGGTPKEQVESHPPSPRGTGCVVVKGVAPCPPELVCAKLNAGVNNDVVAANVSAILASIFRQDKGLLNKFFMKYSLLICFCYFYITFLLFLYHVFVIFTYFILFILLFFMPIYFSQIIFTNQK